MALVGQLPVYVHVLTMFVASFAALATVTPTLKDDSIAAKMTRMIDLFGMNFGKASNK